LLEEHHTSKIGVSA